MTGVDLRFGIDDALRLLERAEQDAVSGIGRTAELARGMLRAVAEFDPAVLGAINSAAAALVFDFETDPRTHFNQVTVELNGSGYAPRSFANMSKPLPGGRHRIVVLVTRLPDEVPSR